MSELSSLLKVAKKRLVRQKVLSRVKPDLENLGKPLEDLLL